MVARRQFRHHAAISSVRCYLRVYYLGTIALCWVVQRHCGFVAGAFDAEEHIVGAFNVMELLSSSLKSRYLCKQSSREFYAIQP